MPFQPFDQPLRVAIVVRFSNEPSKTIPDYATSFGIDLRAKIGTAYAYSDCILNNTFEPL